MATIAVITPSIGLPQSTWKAAATSSIPTTGCVRFPYRLAVADVAPTSTDGTGSMPTTDLAGI
jgi:hypothetical protein